MEKTQPIPSTTGHGLSSSEDGSIQIDYAAEQKLVRKLDVRLPVAIIVPIFRGKIPLTQQIAVYHAVTMSDKIDRCAIDKIQFDHAVVPFQLS